MLVNMVTKVLPALWALLVQGVLLVLRALQAKMAVLDNLVPLDLLVCEALRAARDLLALPVPLVPLDLPVQVEVVMTLALMETSTGLTSPAHHLLSDPRIMKLMPL